ncbi:MAG: hypothetical protein KAU50_06095 [Candidatus Marinimicrobia bacterium]|nr:hypothetical protein [Candidatus Neomarinimicrobiota bacterium]
MRRIGTGLVLVWLLLGFGCLVPSINPLYDAETLVAAPEILGKWQSTDEADANEIWEFRQNDELKYDFHYTDGSGLTGKFEAHVAQLGEYRFLDLYPDNETLDSKIPDVYLFHLIPAHTFFRLWLDEGKLHLADLDLEWVDEQIRQGKLRLDHIRANDRIILTGETSDLQRWIVEHVDEAFSDPTILRRTEPVPE